MHSLRDDTITVRLLDLNRNPEQIQSKSEVVFLQHVLSIRSFPQPDIDLVQSIVRGSPETG